MNLGNILGKGNDGNVKVYAQETIDGTSANIIEPTTKNVPVVALANGNGSYDTNTDADVIRENCPSCVSISPNEAGNFLT